MTTFTGASLLTWLLIVAGNIFMAIFLVRSLQYYAQRDWGAFTGNLIVGLIIAYIVYFNSNFIALIKAIAKLFFG